MEARRWGAGILDSEQSHNFGRRRLLIAEEPFTLIIYASARDPAETEGTFAVSADSAGGVTASITEGQFKVKLP